MIQSLSFLRQADKTINYVVKSAQTPNGLHALDWILIAIYFVLISGLGLVIWWYQKKKKLTSSSHQFFTGGRNPTFVVGMSIFATILSSIAYVSLAGTIFGTGWMWVAANIATIGITPFITMIIIPMYRRFKETTAYSYLENRFNYSMRAVTSLSFILFQVFRVAVVLYIPTVALSIFVNASPYLILGLLTLVLLISTVLGGFKSVLWNDAIQGGVLLIGMVLVLIFALAKTNWSSPTIQYQPIITSKSWEVSLAGGGMTYLFIYNIFNSAYTFMGSQSIVQRYKSTKTAKEVKRTLWITAGLGVITIFLFFGAGSAIWTFYSSHGFDMQHKEAIGAIVASQNGAQIGSYVETTTTTTNAMGHVIKTVTNGPFTPYAAGASELSGTGLTSGYLSGTNQILAYHPGTSIPTNNFVATTVPGDIPHNGSTIKGAVTIPGHLDGLKAMPGDNNAVAYFNGISLLPNFIASELPMGIVGIIFAAVFAASQSTVSSGLSAMANCISIDFIKRWTKIEDKYLTLISKGVITFFGLLGMAMGMGLVASHQDDIMNYFTGVVSLFAIPVLGAFILGLFTERTNWVGALVGVISGFIATLFLWVFSQKFMPENLKIVFWSPYLTFISLGIALPLGYGLSWIMDLLHINVHKKDLTNRTWFTRTAEFKALTKLEEEMDVVWDKISREKYQYQQNLWLKKLFGKKVVAFVADAKHLKLQNDYKNAENQFNALYKIVDQQTV